MKLFSKYTITSLLTIALDFIIIITLTEFFNIYYLHSVIIGFLVSGLIGFLCNKRYIFHSTVSIAFGYSKSIVVAGLCLLIIFYTTLYLTTYLSIHYLVSRLLAGILGGIIAFFLDRKFTFKI